MRRLLACLFGLGVLTLAAGACSSDSKQVEDEIVKALERDAQIDAKNVECPEDADAKEGAEFDCTFDVDGEKATAHVVFRSDTEFEITDVQPVTGGDTTDGTEEDTDASS